MCQSCANPSVCDVSCLFLHGHTQRTKHSCLMKHGSSSSPAEVPGGCCKTVRAWKRVRCFVRCFRGSRTSSCGLLVNEKLPHA